MTHDSSRASMVMPSPTYSAPPPRTDPTSAVQPGAVVSELALTESRTMRSATVDRTDVLDKVKALALLPDGIHATTDIVASFFETDTEAIKKLVQRHRAELEENGLRKLAGPELAAFARDTLSPANGISPMARTLHLFTRRTILNVGQLLTESPVARRVRTFLLDSEAERRAVTVPQSFAEALELAAAQQRALEVSQAQVAALGPKAAKYDQLLDADGLVGMTAIADMLDIYVGDLTDWLVERGLFRKQVSERQSGPKIRNMPRREWQRSGHFEVIPERHGRAKFPVAYATSTGLDLIITKWGAR